MAKLQWDQTSERLYQTGVDRGVLFPFTLGAYGAGVAWNGLTAVNENPTGAEPNDLYADNRKYLSLYSAEQFGCTIEAYTYPDEFAECDGSKAAATGLYFTQQTRKMFGFCYRTLIGNDTEGTDHGYMIHFVYGAMASPSDKGNSTVNENPDAVTLSWEVTTTPIDVQAEGYKPLAHVYIDSTKIDATKLAAIEEIIYGSDGTPGTTSRLPLPDELITLAQ